MVEFLFRASFMEPNWNFLTGISSFTLAPNGETQLLYAGSKALGGVTGFTLAEGSVAQGIGEWVINGQGNGFQLEDLAWLDLGASSRLFRFGNRERKSTWFPVANGRFAGAGKRAKFFWF